jgi:hypothetical protein
MITFVYNFVSFRKKLFALVLAHIKYPHEYCINKQQQNNIKYEKQESHRYRHIYVHLHYDIISYIVRTFPIYTINCFEYNCNS